MDVSVNNVRLSDLGFAVLDFDDSAANVTADFTNMKGRNTRIFEGATYGSRTITVTVRFRVSNQKAYDAAKMKLHQYVSSDSISSLGMWFDNLRWDVYNFKQPDSLTEPITFLSAAHFTYLKNNSEKSAYYYRVFLSGEPTYKLVTYDSSSFIYEAQLTFVTADVPFRIKALSGWPVSLGSTVPYMGTYPLRQIDWPFTIEVSISSSASSISLQTGSSIWTLNRSVSSGSSLDISATTVRLNGQDVTQYSDLTDLQIVKNGTIASNVNGSVNIRNGLEFYK